MKLVLLIPWEQVLCLTYPCLYAPRQERLQSIYSNICWNNMSVNFTIWDCPRDISKVDFSLVIKTRNKWLPYIRFCTSPWCAVIRHFSKMILQFLLLRSINNFTYLSAHKMGVPETSPYQRYWVDFFFLLFLFPIFPLSLPSFCKYFR